ncbi:MAG: mechanosensitive ion channel family protein [Actinomycetia bacterium]|nr:mechanosensitive ion channel family protein [Actinomycetes bacterium]MCG2790424.1 mechanosensitive ion channel family protein [Actinomycetes bacterium]
MATNSIGINIDSQKIIENFKVNWITITIVVLAVLLIILIVRAVSRRLRILIEKKIGDEKLEIRKRTFTFNSVLSNLIIVLSAFIGILIIAEQIGISILPIITGAGIIGIIFGLGAQSLIKDLINGSFILFEQWYQVNDIITVGDITGTVERFSLRTTVIRDLEGVLHYIPNSEIKVLSNRTAEWARAVVDVGVHYKESTDKVVEVLSLVFDEIMTDAKYGPCIIERPEILGDGGVSELGDSAVVFKIICKVKPPNQWTIARQLRKRIKDKFDEVGIEIPYPCRNLYMRNDG